MLPAAHNYRRGCGPASSMSLLNGAMAQILQSSCCCSHHSDSGTVPFLWLHGRTEPKEALALEGTSILKWLGINQLSSREHPEHRRCDWPLSTDQEETLTLCTIFTNCWPYDNPNHYLNCHILSLCLDALSTWGAHSLPLQLSTYW